MFAWPTRILLPVFVLALGPGRAWAQTTGAGRTSTVGAPLWVTLTSDARLSDKWGGHAEAQWRHARGPGASRQRLLRFGVTYQAGSSLSFTGGYTHVLTFPAGDLTSATQLPEHRIYEQLQLDDHRGRLQLQHRYRLEQRWVQLADQAAPTYLNRLRYQLRLAYPLSGPKLKPGGTYLVAADELFLGFGANNQRGIFDQNRAYAALGYQITKALALEAGYLNQLRAASTPTDFGSPHSIQAGIVFSPDFRPTLPETAAALQ